jgi:galactose mutarotase-like enzyme
VKFPDSPYLAFWSKPGAPFICIEPWHGIADPVGFTGDFTEKPGVFMVPTGAERAFRMHITLVGSNAAVSSTLSHLQGRTPHVRN